MLREKTVGPFVVRALKVGEIEDIRQALQAGDSSEGLGKAMLGAAVSRNGAPLGPDGYRDLYPDELDQLNEALNSLHASPAQPQADGGPNA